MPENQHDTLPPAQDPDAGGAIAPPTTFGGILRRLGPGLIIAGSIVGSGELILTTKTGAQAGMSLLWLIVIGCLIKIFVQIELGRHTISHGETTLVALNRVPGPRLRVNWIVWFWLGMMLVGIGQLGGIVGGVGQSLAISFPLGGDYVDAIRMPSSDELKAYHQWNEHILTEWDIRLLNRFDDQLEGTERALPGLNDGESRWARSTVNATREKLDRLDDLGGGPTARDLIADVARLQAFESTTESAVTIDSRGDISTRADYDALSRDIRQQFERANLALLRHATAELHADDSPWAERTQRPGSQQRRLIRGHGILSQQLGRLDRDQRRATQAMARVVEWVDAEQRLARAEQRLKEAQSADADVAVLRQARVAAEVAGVEAASARRVVDVLVEPYTLDDKYWAAIATAFTALLLYRGRYRLIQNVSLVLVVSFTFITIGNVVSLQATERFAVPASEFLRGLAFHLPESTGGKNPLGTALATFGIIGVGASELISYPYWCLEKGYARFTGPRSSDAGWAERARGWMRVMHYDAFLSMVVYTIATVAFFIMGSAVLYNEGRDPDGMRMVSTLATAYVPVFGEYARWLFLIGAIAVLYSTFLVANASHARTYTDALKLFGLLDRRSQRKHDRSVGAFSVLLPLVCLAVYATGINPVRAIQLAAAMQALLLPMIGLGALYFRYTRTDERLRPTPLWDVLLSVSCLGLLIAGAWSLWENEIRNAVLIVTAIGLLAAALWSYRRRNEGRTAPER